jgi:hypothetical protein
MPRPRFVVSSVLLTSGALSALAGVAGCSGSSEHPPPSGETTSPLESTNDDYDPVEAAAARARADACAPGSARACHVYFLLNGQPQCPIRTQYCRRDGTSWLACGDPPEGGGAAIR